MIKLHTGSKKKQQQQQ